MDTPFTVPANYTVDHRTELLIRRPDPDKDLYKVNIEFDRNRIQITLLHTSDSDLADKFFEGLVQLYEDLKTGCGNM